ncbi:MAG: nuclear transport factor 2 family protein [Iamia sp.]
MTETTMPDAPIQATLARWHEVVRGDHAGLPDLLADDVVFLSPVVFTPQRGKEITTMYLTAAFGSLAGSNGGSGQGSDGPRFRYVRELVGTHDAILEFETDIDGTHVNGVDMIRVDDGGRIVEFKVMVRPLQAMNKLHEVMRAQLEAMADGGS